jgi:hypothetical protein
MFSEMIPFSHPWKSLFVLINLLSVVKNFKKNIHNKYFMLKIINFRQIIVL